MASFTLTGLGTTFQTLAAGELGFISTTGLLIPTTGTSVTITGSNASVVNQGTIYGPLYGIFVDSVATSTTISNSGEILAQSLAIYVNTAGGTSNTTIVNSGVIRGLTVDTDGIFIGTGSNRITNYGEITMIGDEAIQLSSGFNAGFLMNRIWNDGTMSNASGGRVILTANDQDYLTNTGTLMGNIFLAGAEDRLFNRGLISGEIDLGIGDDLFDGRGGSVSGTVRGDAGNDRLFGGDEDDTLRGEDGNDSLYGGNGDDLLSGDVGDNLVIGGAGNDDLESDLGTSTLYGGAGDDRVGVFVDGLADFLYGGVGTDTLVLDGKFSDAGVTVGRMGAITTFTLNDAPATPATTGTAAQFEALEFLGSNFGDDVTATTGDDILRGAVDDTTLDDDRLLGLAGDDRINGVNGDDSLYGGDGADVLTGGLGRDELYGGTGADRFVFTLTTESPDTANRDRLRDFEAGVDRIDLTGIDANTTNGAADDAFAYLAAGAFTGVAGQLRYTVSGANIILRGDVDGDSVADFSLHIFGAASLAVGDLIL